MNNTKLIEQIAQIVHEANKALCETAGDMSQKSWNDAAEWQKDAAREGVKEILTNKNISDGDMHIKWCEFKIADGWKYGPVKDGVKKTHPCLIPFAELDKIDQQKDALFVAIVRALSKND